MLSDLLLRTCSISLVIMLGATAFGPSARAELVTYSFTGTINVVDDPNDDLLGGQVKLGGRFSGTLVYDTSTARLMSSESSYSVYLYPTTTSGSTFVPPIGITAQVGSYSITPKYRAGDLIVNVFNNEPVLLGSVADGLSASQEEWINSDLFYAYSVYLNDPSESVFSSTALPTSLSTSDFTIGTFTFYKYPVVSENGGYVARPVVVFQGMIHGLQAVPEPSSLTLCGLAIPALLVLRRRFAA